MPPVSEKQRRFMRAAASNPKLRKERGISKSVADEFNAADKGGKLPKRSSKKGTKHG